MIRPATLAVVLAVSIGSAAHAQPTQEDEKLAALIGATNDRFGISTAAYGSWAVIGAPNNDEACTDCGRAYVYHHDGTGWSEEATLFPIEAPEFERLHFAQSVALHGDVIAVGAPDADDCAKPYEGCDSGAIYVYRHTDGAWIEEARVVPFDVEDPDAEYYSLGEGVAVEGDVLVGGAPTANTSTGYLYVYRYDGANWLPEQRLEGLQEQQIVLGFTVAISGNVIVAGAHREDVNGVPDAGAVYVYRHDGASWVLETKLTAPTAAEYERFGRSVAVYGNMVVVGGPQEPFWAEVGRAYVYRYDGANWALEDTLEPSSGTVVDQFGWSVDVQDGLIAVGANRRTNVEEVAGTVYTFSYNGTTWDEQFQLVASDPVPGAMLGQSVAVTPTSILAGAMAADGFVAGTGATYVYSLDTDGDGLFDDWETNGIPYVDEETGEDRRYILDWDHDDVSDAHPQRIDLFVEIDAMDGPGLAPTEADLQRVKDAFARAPVDNPDGTTGVRLHLEFSDMETPVEFFAGGLAGGFFDGYKDLWFGTNESSSELTAKRKAYRYCVFGSTHSGGSSSGQAEIGGNDFIVTLGAWTPVGGTSEQKAGTFMHELGHTLGLQHSGPLSELSDEELAGPDTHYNLKPNYYSIMNYLWQTPKGWHTPGSWPLLTGSGYSATAVPALDESDLDEMVGIVPDTLSDVFPAPGFAVPHNVALAADPPIVRRAVLAAGQAVDWNGSGGFDEHDPGDPIARDVNRVRQDWPSSVDTTLGGYADWPYLDYNFRDSPDYADGEHSTAEDNEITAEEDAALDAVLPPACVGDVTLNGTTDFVDLLEVLAHWGPCAEGIACVHDLDEDGSVGFGDLLVLLAAWGPCE